MSKDLISVIIPVYNTAPYLERCISSVTENTYKNLEIICVNDGSTDDSLEVLNRLAAKDPRIRVIDQPNGGVSAARNHGLDVASGEYVAFVDSDDWIHREYFALLAETAHEKDAELVICGLKSVDAYSAAEKDAPLQPADAFSLSTEDLWAAGGNVSGPHCKLFKRAFLRDHRYPLHIQYGEDTIFNILLYSRQETMRVFRIELPMYYYFNRPGSLVHNPDASRYLDMVHYLFAHINEQYRKDFILAHAYRLLYSYRHEGFIVCDKKIISKNVRAAFRRARYWLLREKRFSAKEKLKYLVAEAFPALYRAQLLSKDPTMRIHEEILKERACMNLKT